MKFDDTETEEHKFHQYESPISINDININEIVFKLHSLNKILNISLVTKILKNRHLCILRPKMSIYKKGFDKNKCIYFLIKNERFFEKHNDIWET